MNYQDVANKVTEFIRFKAQITSMQQEIAALEGNPPRLEKEVLTWEEAVDFAESEKAHDEKLKQLRMGIANRQEIVQNKEQEIGEMLPIKDRYILFKLHIDEAEHTYKIGYFPASYGFRMERAEDEI